MSNMPFTFNQLLEYRSREHLLHMDDQARKQLLSELLDQTPTQAAWMAICELFASWPESEGKTKALIESDQVLVGWDDRLRKISSAWRYLYDGRNLALVARLARSIEIYRREEHGSRELRAIADSEHVENLKYLTVIRSELSSPAIRALSDSPYLGNLQYLEIRRTVLFSEDIDYLFQAKGFHNLTTLKLIDVGLKYEQLYSLNKSTSFRNLQEIDFSDNLLMSEGLTSISQAWWLASIKKLELRSNHIQDDGISGFTKSPHIKSLKILDLSDNPLTEAGIKNLRIFAAEKGFRLIL